MGSAQPEVCPVCNQPIAVPLERRHAFAVALGYFRVCSICDNGADKATGLYGEKGELLGLLVQLREGLQEEKNRGR